MEVSFNRACIVFAAVISLHVLPAFAFQPQDQCFTSVTFPPGAAAVITAEIDDASDEILVAIYSITHTAITDALIRARARGVRVAVKADRMQSTGRAQKIELERLRLGAVGVSVSDLRRTMHHKVIVIDRLTVLTGSYNFSESAERRNEENLVVLECDLIAERYRERWLRIR